MLHSHEPKAFVKKNMLNDLKLENWSVLTTGTTHDHTTFLNQQLDFLSQWPLRVQTAHCMRSHPVGSKHPDHACSNSKLPSCSTSSGHLLYMIAYDSSTNSFPSIHQLYQFNCLKVKEIWKQIVGLTAPTHSPA